MEIKLARFVAIAIVVTVLGGLMLTSRAKRIEQRLVAPPPTVRAPAAGALDSARAVVLAEDAYRLDHAARGLAATPVRVMSFLADSLGFVLQLAPRDAGPGARVAVRVRRTGEVELRRLDP